MRTVTNKEAKKGVVKDIILNLHKGLSAQDAKERFVNEVGNITSTEIAEIEQSLINDGLSPEEIKKFCNVHALLFESTLQQTVIQEESPAHPVYLFKQENRAIAQLTASLKTLGEQQAQYGAPAFTEQVKQALLTLKGLDVHYTRKEQVLFPYLEKYGFFGPSKVMWGKDNEIRDLLRNALTTLERTGADEQFVTTAVLPLIEEVNGMIFKEENILFPTTLEKLSVNDWVEILQESDEVGYVFIEKPSDTLALITELRNVVTEEAAIKDDHTVALPTGELNLNELLGVLNGLPVDITFIDKDDKVKYFSAGKERLFVRTKAVIGRQVQHCHPPQSVETVEKILNSFKAGQRDAVSFWINFQGKLIFIRYFAVRDAQQNYLGTLEVTQDITGIQKLQGEKRLLDEA